MMTNLLKVDSFNIIDLPNYKEITNIIEKTHNGLISESDYIVHYLKQISSEKTKQEYYRTSINEITAVYYAQAIYLGFQKFINIINQTKVANSFKDNIVEYLKKEINSNADKHIFILNKLSVGHKEEIFYDYVKDNFTIMKYDSKEIAKLFNYHYKSIGVSGITKLLSELDVTSELEKLMFEDFKKIVRFKTASDTKISGWV